MDYKFAPNKNYEDLSSGRVIFHQLGFSNFPTRLASEIFMRCCELIETPDEKVKIYDPCCGGGYLLTILGFLHNEKIAKIYGSDISVEAVHLAQRNLGLLKTDGLIQRKAQLTQLYERYEKDSHLGALESVDRLSELMNGDLGAHVFVRDILKTDLSDFELPLVDIIMTDVPYGDLVSWSGDACESNKTGLMLEQLSVNLKESGVIAVISNKKQKITNPNFNRVSKIQIGKRKVEFFKKN